MVVNTRRKMWTELSIARTRAAVNKVRVLLNCDMCASPKNDFLCAASYADDFLTVDFEAQSLGIICKVTQAKFSKQRIFITR